MKLVYAACFYPQSDGKGGYTVEFPDLPGCVTEGDSLPGAIEMATDAASGWILDELEDGGKIPVATPAGKVSPEKPDCIISLVMLDMDSYAEKHGSKAVRKNLTIPAWLATAAEKKHINFSGVLQEALMQKLKITD
jgi:predicted RNase H-like HicB family nuclease